MACSFDPVWEDIYLDGRQLNKYPYDSVVSFLHACHGKTQQKDQVRILEIGCGAGNNLWFAAREGFSVVGLDGSEAAITYARERFARESLPGEFHIGDFVSIPLESDSFDVVIDRGALTCAGASVAGTAAGEVRRVLKSGGLLFSELLGAGSNREHVMLNDDLIGHPMDNGKHMVTVRLYDREKILATLGEGWRYREMWRRERRSLMDNRVFVHWHVVAERV